MFGVYNFVFDIIEYIIAVIALISYQPAKKKKKDS